MKELVGKTIQSVLVNADETRMRFVCDDGPVTFEVDGDCCSSSWFADVVGYQALADFYLSQKNYDEAAKVVRAGIQQQPDMVALHMILVGVLERKGDYEAAISEYEFMLDKQPGNMIVSRSWGTKCLSAGSSLSIPRKATTRSRSPAT